MKSQQEVVSGVKEWTKWWIGQRRKKIGRPAERNNVNQPIHDAFFV